MNTSCCIPDYSALFLYVRPDNKVKPVSIMILRVEMIFLAVLYHHPFVAKKGGDFDRLAVITTDITIGKNGIQRSPMYTLQNLLIWIERFFGWSADNLYFG